MAQRGWAVTGPRVCVVATVHSEISKNVCTDIQHVVRVSVVEIRTPALTNGKLVDFSNRTDHLLVYRGHFRANFDFNRESSCWLQESFIFDFEMRRRTFRRVRIFSGVFMGFPPVGTCRFSASPSSPLLKFSIKHFWIHSKRIRSRVITRIFCHLRSYYIV